MINARETTNKRLSGAIQMQQENPDTTRSQNSLDNTSDQFLCGGFAFTSDSLCDAAWTVQHELELGLADVEPRGDGLPDSKLVPEDVVSKR